ncbi:BrnA antitoxin family protein [Candidatus Kirkpatrickella diaphorinae]|uniref:BrnA antitoxin family protein n=1 Tax=Candidatus Kirkpatrickella diaphorinae TaxID=2984322 RepID=A0ABY6GJX3_9PROT|nr:BrnA antitoxin family protein [Candidatus Kirkpatrickella diaphorinae]UYH51830.1 BrnA antitoxin family protein [Candidatus Kirkpatrickella diaphorinae]
MRKKQSSGQPELRDPDDAPELTDAFFDAATIREGSRIVRRGRPRKETTKTQVTLRLDADIVETYRQQGPGWQSRINAALRATLGR